MCKCVVLTKYTSDSTRITSFTQTAAKLATCWVCKTFSLPYWSDPIHAHITHGERNVHGITDRTCECQGSFHVLGESLVDNRTSQSQDNANTKNKR
jgi:hypothetical protein